MLEEEQEKLARGEHASTTRDFTEWTSFPVLGEPTAKP